MAEEKKDILADLSAFLKLRQKPRIGPKRAVTKAERGVRNAADRARIAAHPVPPFNPAARGRLPYKLNHRIALAMAPGLWYARPDIGLAMRRPARSIQPVIARMMKKELLERVADQSEAGDVMYLYRLTRTGEALRRQAEWLQ